jgi:hypothetical protein
MNGRWSLEFMLEDVGYNFAETIQKLTVNKTGKSLRN